MLTLESQLTEYSQEFINNLFSKKVWVIPKSLTAENIGVRMDAEGEVQYYYARHEGHIDMIEDEDLLRGEHDAIISEISKLKLPADAWYEFIRLSDGSLLLIDMKVDTTTPDGNKAVEPVPFDTQIELGEKLNLKTFPLYYAVQITAETQEVLREWCGYTDAKKKKLLGSVSFTRLVIYMLTGLDPVKVCGSDIDGVLSGFIFKFDDSEYDSELLDPCFTEPVELNIVVSPLEMVRMFVDAFKRQSVYINPDKMQRWEKNFRGIVDSDPETYNKFIVAASQSSEPDTAEFVTSWREFTHDFYQKLKTNDLYLRLFKYYIGIFITGDIDVPDDYKKDVEYYSNILKK